MTKTVIVEDNRLMMNHLRSTIEEAEVYELKAAVTDAFEAEELCREGDVDLCIMDVQTGHNHSGLAAGERIKSLHPQIKIVIVTSLIDPDVLARARSGAADSLWYKDHGSEELMDVIDRTIKGEHVFPDGSPDVELKEMFSSAISPRQMDILRRFVMGMTYDEIAEELKLSKNGVRWNLDQIVEKGGFTNKHEMLAAVIENKLIVTTLIDGD
ncbi:MAG: response regulator transcription factor [Lachnospiraceae bacterium]|nr:response regulator transcription factor [Lachnospiraceae bacterium]